MEVSKIFDGMSPQEIKEALQADCVTSDTRSYRRQFTKEEKELAESEYTDLQKQASVVADKIKVIVDPLKSEKKNLETEAKSLMETIKAGGPEEQGKVYVCHNFEDRTVITYSEEGFMIETRQMNHEERSQLHISSFSRLGKTGTEE